MYPWDSGGLRLGDRDRERLELEAKTAFDMEHLSAQAGDFFFFFFFFLVMFVDAGGFCWRVIVFINVCVCVYDRSFGQSVSRSASQPERMYSDARIQIRPQGSETRW